MNKIAVLSMTITLAGLLGPSPVVASTASPTLAKPAAAAAAGIMPAAALPAHASTPTAPAADSAAACRWGPNPPYGGGRTVSATVWSSGCNQSWNFRGILQRKRWYGWEELDRAHWRGKGARSLSKGCKKGTTFTYRAYVVTWPAGFPKNSPTRRFKCR